MKHPLPWHPSIVETQIFRIGSLLIVGLPGEFTTMAGRRIIRALTNVSFILFLKKKFSRFYHITLQLLWLDSAMSTRIMWQHLKNIKFNVMKELRPSMDRIHYKLILNNSLNSQKL